MRKITFIFAFTFFVFALAYGQSHNVTKESELYSSAPDWAKLMYSKNPNVYQVDQLYNSYYKKNAFVKSNHTQYYKRWRRSITPYIDAIGNIDMNKDVYPDEVIANLRNNQSQSKITQGVLWKPMGPFRNLKYGGVKPTGAMANVYTIGTCLAHTNVMYCGTERGEVYKSSNGGDNWTNISMNMDHIHYNGVSSLAVHPTDSNTVYAISHPFIFKTTNGGLTWTKVLDCAATNNIWGNELHINSANPQIVMLASDGGLSRSDNGGLTWTKIFTNNCFDIKSNVADANKIYAIRDNPTTRKHEFLISNNAGATWTVQTSGWYNSTDTMRRVAGGRIAVTNADSNYVYAYLIGEAKATDVGMIGIYKSIDGGTSWVNNYSGSPYSDSHPNIASAHHVAGIFSQGMYCCAIMASNTNPDEILVGGTGMWRSSDGGQTFQCRYNYSCPIFDTMHVDMQDFRAFGNTYWATTDGGIYKSNNLFDTQPEYKMEGINATEFWGFGQGWNRDIMIGGTFHNGVDVYDEGYPSGSFLELPGLNEPPTGYVNPGIESRIYSSGNGSYIMPQTITGPFIRAPYNHPINESVWPAESSEMEFHTSCYNQIYLGYQNKVFKSIDGGATFNAVAEDSLETFIAGIEVSRQNPNTIYAFVSPPNGVARLLKTTDDWVTSSIIELPNIPNSNCLIGRISIDAVNDQIIWLIYTHANNGNKVFKSSNGGKTWVNLTTSLLDDQIISDVQAIAGTNGGVYVGTKYSCYYRNNTMTNWIIVNNGLPLLTYVNKLKPFYRDGKLRLASYGKGIWETELYEQPTRPIAKIMADKLSIEHLCDTIQFDDYSTLNHSGASWLWTFQNANISTSTIRNPQVTFNSFGSQMVTLTVTDSNQVSSSDTLMVTTVNSPSTNINQNFEVSLLKPGWFLEPPGSYTWFLNDSVGGFGQSSKCMTMDNFNLGSGTFMDLVAPINMTNLGGSYAKLTFDVAYAVKSQNGGDTLQVLVSSDCGLSYNMVYAKGGETLATAPPTQNQFVPTVSNWRTDTVDLSAYIGNPNVFIKFRNFNQHVQLLYLDNINLLGQKTGVPVENIKNINNLQIFPNPVANNGAITIKSDTDQEVELNIYNNEGKVIDKLFLKSNSTVSLDKYNLNDGIYYYSMITESKIVNGKLVVINGK